MLHISVKHRKQMPDAQVRRVSGTKQDHATFPCKGPSLLHSSRKGGKYEHYTVPSFLLSYNHRQKGVPRLSSAAQALTPLNLSGPISCPADFALDYQLDFFRGQTRIQEIVLHPTGCASVEFGKDDFRVFTPAFEQLFMQTVGISNLVPGPL